MSFSHLPLRFPQNEHRVVRSTNLAGAAVGVPLDLICPPMRPMLSLHTELRPRTSLASAAFLSMQLLQPAALDAGVRAAVAHDTLR